MSGAIEGFISGGMNSNHCFVAGTLVQTIDGAIPIEQIEEGEFVLSEGPETGDVTYKHVLETYVNETAELIHLNIDGEEVVTTPAHPFYVKDLGFVLAGDLEVGATLIDSEGNELHLQIKRWEQLQECVPVYNFAVEDYHTYFVGTKNVLVHNECLGGKFSEVDKVRKQTTGKVGHHMPQDAFNNRVLHMSRGDGPALLMDIADHELTCTYKWKGALRMSQDVGMNARQRLARDLWDIKKLFGNKYDEGIKQLLEYALTLEEFAK